MSGFCFANKVLFFLCHTEDCVLGFLAVDVGVGVGVVRAVTEGPVVSGVCDKVDHAHCLCLPDFLESDGLKVAVVPNLKGVSDHVVVGIGVA